jgi:uncharacterized membrane protein
VSSDRRVVLFRLILTLDLTIVDDICLGNVLGSGHPIHPITVHYPLTTLLAAYSTDIAVHSRPYLPRVLTSLLPSTPLLAQIAYYTNAAGLIFLVPSMITGFHEFYEIYKHLGTKRVEDGVVLQAYPQRTFNVAAIHGALNLLTGEFGCSHADDFFLLNAVLPYRCLFGLHLAST